MIAVCNMGPLQYLILIEYLKHPERFQTSLLGLLPRLHVVHHDDVRPLLAGQ